MKLKNYLLALLFAFVFGMEAKQISTEEATNTAAYYLRTNGAFMAKDPKITPAIVYSAAAEGGSGIQYYHVFSFAGLKGFLIISADDIALPLLGYSSESDFNPTNIPWSVAKWLSGYKAEIQNAIANNFQATDAVKLEWKNVRENITNVVKNRAAVGALLQTKWNQSPNYNAQCPYDNTNSQRTVVGCVATAMAQILKYHNYPKQGTGFHSFNHNTYGTLSSNFGNTSYDWTNMPNSISSSNAAVATLGYHCGVSVDMNYGVGSKGGSGAYVIKTQSPVTHCAEYALTTYFGYKSTLSGIERANYSTSSWKSTLKSELNASRPILYAGFGSGGGHCFVCDGYDNSDYFHFNWGWGGSYDGYFSIDALDPAGVGTGGGSGGFNSGHQAVIGIEPPSGGSSPAKSDLVLYTDLSLSASSIAFNGAISGTMNVYNKGTSNFTGDFGLAVFDDNYVFVDFIETKTSMKLTAGNVYTNPLTFSTTGKVAFLPGKYYTALYYKSSGAEWSAVGDYNGHVNWETFTVTLANTIEMYSAFAIGGGGTTITQGKSMSVNVDIANYGSAFSGSLDVSLYDLEGKFVETIETKTGMTMGNNTHYTGGVTFSSSNVTSAPGTYILAILFKPTSGSWSIVGSTSYQNPIKVAIQLPSIAPDIYENNDNASIAYALTPNFSSSLADVRTTGSNCHVGSDYDFYKITLPTGYNYTITPRLHDELNATDGNTYTLDALFSYTIDGTNYSDVFDAVTPSGVVLNNGGTIILKVSPFFTGKTGTYLLQVKIQRQAISNSVSSNTNASIHVYPVPASSELSISVANEKIKEITILDVNGKQVLKNSFLAHSENIKMNVSDLKPGIYFTEIATENHIYQKQICIVR